MITSVLRLPTEGSNVQLPYFMQVIATLFKKLPKFDPFYAFMGAVVFIAVFSLVNWVVHLPNCEDVKGQEVSCIGE